MLPGSLPSPLPIKQRGMHLHQVMHAHIVCTFLLQVPSPPPLKATLYRSHRASTILRRVQTLHCAYTSQAIAICKKKPRTEVTGRKVSPNKHQRIGGRIGSAVDTTTMPQQESTDSNKHKCSLESARASGMNSHNSDIVIKRR